jgi:transcriptional regulator with XRE-family HTH domain
MTLSAWLTAQNLSDVAFAAQIGVTRQALYRYKHGERFPHRDVMARIIDATDGAVTPNDFMQSAGDGEAA